MEGEGTPRPGSEPLVSAAEQAVILSPEQKQQEVNRQRGNAVDTVKLAQAKGDIFNTAESRLAAGMVVEGVGGDRAVLAALRVTREYASDAPGTLNVIQEAYGTLSSGVMISIGDKSAPLNELEAELEGISIDEARLSELEAELAKPDLDETTRNGLEVELKGINDVKNRRDAINKAITEGLSTQTILREVADGVARGSDSSPNGESLKNVLEVISASKDQVPGAREAYAAVSENTLITFDGRLYSLSDLQTERASATPERAIEIDKIIKEGTYERSLEVGERLVDQAVEEQIASLTAKVAEAEKAGRDVRKEKEILGRLKGLTGGQARHAIAISSFRQLQSMGVTGLDQVIKGGAGLEAVSIEKIKETLRSNNYTESQINNILIPQILNGDVKALMEGEVLKKPGVDLLFFDKSKSDAELQEWMKSMYPKDAEELWKKHGKNAALAILMLIAMGVYPNVKKMIIPG